MDWKPGESASRPAMWSGYITGLSGPHTPQTYQEPGRTTGKDLSEVLGSSPFSCDRISLPSCLISSRRFCRSCFIPEQEKPRTPKQQPPPQPPSPATTFTELQTPQSLRLSVRLHLGFHSLSSGRGVARMVTCCFSNSRTLFSSLTIVCRIVRTWQGDREG